VVVDPVGVVAVVGGAIVVAGRGEVMAGIETLGLVVVSPELPQPEASRPIAMVESASARITRSR
jgi:mannitol-specific phosphotransferase system IIBC component